MQSLYTLYMLVDKYATEIEKLNLDGDQLEEYAPFCCTCKTRWRPASRATRS